MKSIKQGLTLLWLLVITSSILFGCDSGPQLTQDPKKAANETIPSGFGLARNGQIYFATHCGGCHAAGSDDKTTAFGATDLLNSNNTIESDISRFGEITISGNTVSMMSRFANIPQDRVDDLKKYLAILK